MVNSSSKTFPVSLEAVSDLLVQVVAKHQRPGFSLYSGRQVNQVIESMAWDVLRGFMLGEQNLPAMGFRRER